MFDPIRWIVIERVKPHVNCKIVTKYSPIFFANFDKHLANLCNNRDQT